MAGVDQGSQNDDRRPGKTGRDHARRRELAGAGEDDHRERDRFDRREARRTGGQAEDQAKAECRSDEPTAVGEQSASGSAQDGRVDRAQAGGWIDGWIDGAPAAVRQRRKVLPQVPSQTT